MKDYRIKIFLCDAQLYADMKQCKYYTPDGCGGCEHFEHDDTDEQPISRCNYDDEQGEAE